MGYSELLLGLAIDLVAITILTYGIYFRRHHRRDLTLGFMGVNVGLFAVGYFVSTRAVGLAFGIGLFALLSVIRLRSTLITQEEIGYYFVAIVIGLVNGVSPDEHWGTTITLTVVLLAVMFVADSPRLLRNYQRRIVLVKSVYRDETELRRVLERKLGVEVVNVTVIDVDLVHKRMRVDVRYRPRPPGTLVEEARPAAAKESGPVAAEEPGPVAAEEPGPVTPAQDLGPLAAERPGPVTPAQDTGPAAARDSGPEVAREQGVTPAPDEGDGQGSATDDEPPHPPWA